jgi:hypothetical protein
MFRYASRKQFLLPVLDLVVADRRMLVPFIALRHYREQTHTEGAVGAGGVGGFDPFAMHFREQDGAPLGSLHQHLAIKAGAKAKRRTVGTIKGSEGGKGGKGGGGTSVGARTANHLQHQANIRRRTDKREQQQTVASLQHTTDTLEDHLRAHTHTHTHVHT